MQDVERIRFLTGRAVLRIVEGVTLILLTAVVLVDEQHPCFYGAAYPAPARSPRLPF